VGSQSIGLAIFYVDIASLVQNQVLCKIGCKFPIEQDASALLKSFPNHEEEAITRHEICSFA